MFIIIQHYVIKTSYKIRFVLIDLPFVKSYCLGCMVTSLKTIKARTNELKVIPSGS